jgi:hypothetical protein
MKNLRLLTRSALFVPGDRLKAIEKAATLPADVVIIGKVSNRAHFE